MSKVRNAVIANLTFLVGQMEELKSNINDTMRYVKGNAEEWDTENDQVDSKNEFEKGVKETQE